MIRHTVPADLIDETTKFIVNGIARFVISGTSADSGLRGRKTVVDSYGGVGRSGEDCFSGKDPTRVTTQLLTWQADKTKREFFILTVIVQH